MTSPVARLVLEQIRGGTFTPDELEEIRQACMDQWISANEDPVPSGFTGMKVSANFAIGDRVMLVDPIRPVYLRGITGTITGRKIKRLEFRPDASFAAGKIARFLRDGVVGVTENMIKKI
jgi:hypothetical protein